MGGILPIDVEDALAGGGVRRAEPYVDRALDLSVDFAADELMRTEISCKFRRDRLTAELAECGLKVRKWWTDEAERFAVLLAVPSS